MNPKKCSGDKNPFENLNIDSWSVLEQIDHRSPCSVCSKSRKYFCYSCYVPVQELHNRIPRVKLPIKIDIIKHRREIDGKSTAAHVAILAPDDVKVYTYPCIPTYSKDEKVVLIYPGKSAKTLEDFFNSQSINNGKVQEKMQRLPIEKAVFIDSTWNQSHGIFKDERLQALPCIALKSRVSQFWRHQKNSPRWYLATVEAIHEFLIDLHVTNSLLTIDSRNCESSASELSSPYKKCVHSCVNSSCECVIPSISGLHINACDSSEKRKSECSQNVFNKEIEIGADSTENGMSSHKVTLYNGEYDNLLFFFSYMYNKIHKLYSHDDLRAYKRPLS